MDQSQNKKVTPETAITSPAEVVKPQTSTLSEQKNYSISRLDRFEKIVLWGLAITGILGLLALLTVFPNLDAGDFAGALILVQVGTAFVGLLFVESAIVVYKVLRSIKRKQPLRAYYYFLLLPALLIFLSPSFLKYRQAKLNQDDLQTFYKSQGLDIVLMPVDIEGFDITAVDHAAYFTVFASYQGTRLAIKEAKREAPESEQITNIRDERTCTEDYSTYNSYICSSQRQPSSLYYFTGQYRIEFAFANPNSDKLGIANTIKSHLKPTPIDRVYFFRTKSDLKYRRLIQ